MNRNELLERLQIIFRTVFQDQKIIISESIKPDDIKFWDSLTHLQLIDTIEKEFQIAFSFDEVLSFNNVRIIVDCILKKK